MSWDLTGQRITGLYLGAWPFTGTVEESRVAYGGTVKHTVVVDEPFKVYGEVRERIIVDTFSRILDERDAEINDTWYDDQYETE
jgi:hypothetical protein